VILKIDLHTHTHRYSSCSVLSPEALCEAALACGRNALAITEHDYQWSPAEIAELQARYPALRLYAGVEISCADGHDYVTLGLEPGSYPSKMAYPRLQALLDAHPGAFCYVAHCFRYSDDENGLAGRQIDGIEVGSYNTLARPQPPSGLPVIVRHEQYLRWQQEMGWIALYNSDAHAHKMVGTFYNAIEAPDGPPEDERTLGQLLRTAEVRAFQDETRIRAAVNGQSG
jgi:hypothetical protein